MPIPGMSADRKRKGKKGANNHSRKQRRAEERALKKLQKKDNV